MKISNYLVIPFLFILSISNCFADGDNNSIYGLFGGVNFNMNTADFNKLSGIPNCCPQFESGSGIGYSFGLLYDYKLSSSLFIGGRIGYSIFNGDLDKPEKTTIISEGSYVTGEFTHYMYGEFSNLGIEPIITYTPIDNLMLSAGIRLSTNLSYTFEQREELTSPSGVGTFIDSLGNDTRSRVRNVANGEIPNANSFQMFLLAGIGYELPLNKDNSYRLVPEVFYHQNLTEFVQNTSWNINSLRVGVSLKYYPQSVEPIHEEFREEYRLDTVRIEKEILADNEFKQGIPSTETVTQKTGSKIISTDIITRTDTLFVKKKYKLVSAIDAVGVDYNGNEIQNPVFTIEEFVSSRLDPLLNYIFFDESSSEIPDRYLIKSPEETGSFEIDSLYNKSVLGIYSNIFNIIGKRLRDNPNATLTIVGCNSGTGAEKDDIILSKARAENAAKILTESWGIEKSRIIIQSRNLPEKASKPLDEPEKTSENRRVEFYSDNKRILEPVFTRSVTRTANPPIVRFHTATESDAGIKEWNIEAVQENPAGAETFNQKGISEIPEHVDWMLENMQESVPRNPEPVQYRLSVTDKKGNIKSTDGETLPISIVSLETKRKERAGDYEIERFSLILFDFDKSTIEANNKAIIDLIAGRIKPDSEIEITGFTDRTGENEYNKKLSARRAEAAKSALKREDASSKGIGEESLLYDNDLPEGRFYCRTVVITVKTKVSN